MELAILQHFAKASATKSAYFLIIICLSFPWQGHSMWESLLAKIFYPTLSTTMGQYTIINISTFVIVLASSTIA